MSKRKNPDTSLEAYRSLDPIKISQIMIKISEAVKVLGKANYEMVASHLGMKEERVWKRFIDCVRANLIHRTDETRQTKQNRKSYLYAPGPSTETIQREQKVMKGKTVADHSRAIKKLSQPILNQPERLF
jgi:predicted transcriptional regulator